MNLFFHELIHVILSLLVAYCIWKFSNLRSKVYHLKSIIFASLLGGFFIDIDHLFDYVVAFGLRFRIDYFFKGYQFLKSNKIYLLLHSWELVAFIVLIVLLTFKHSNFRTLKLALLTFSIALFLHLIVDMKVDYVSLRGYSFIYRWTHNFDLNYFVPVEHYQKHLKLKSEVKL